MNQQSSGPFKGQDWGLQFRDKYACRVTLDCIQANKVSIANILSAVMSVNVGSTSGKTYRLVVDDSDPESLGISIIEVT